MKLHGGNFLKNLNPQSKLVGLASCKKIGLTQNCPSKARRRRQYELYGKAAQRRWGGFA
jgi:hypothetical protein